MSIGNKKLKSKGRRHEEDQQLGIEWWKITEKEETKKKQKNKRIAIGTVMLTVFNALLAFGDEFIIGANVQDIDQHFRHYNK